jgi:hypothetical protein
MAAENHGSDPLISETEQQGRRAGGGRAMAAANLFDLRRIIGGLFIVYGLLLTILGATDSDAVIRRAAGININLVAGLGMLAFGALMLLWAFTRPLGAQLSAAEEDEGGEYAGRAAPRGTDAAALPSDQRRRGAGRDRERPAGEGDPGR